MGLGRGVEGLSVVVSCNAFKVRGLSILGMRAEELYCAVAGSVGKVRGLSGDMKRCMTRRRGCAVVRVVECRNYDFLLSRVKRSRC